MTEQEWLTCENPGAMLHALEVGDVTGASLTINEHTSSLKTFTRHPALTDRKLRLFSAACAILSYGYHQAITYEHGYDEWSNGEPASDDHDRSTRFVAQSWCETNEPQHGEITWAQKAALLRELIGNPFRQPGWTPPRNWRHDSGFHWTVINLAQTAYDKLLENGTLDPARLGVLADALEDADCHDEEILQHCRSKGYVPCYANGDATGVGWFPLTTPHVRGCWVVDLLLGKS